VEDSAKDNQTLWHIGPAPAPQPARRGEGAADAITRHDFEAASPPPKQERFAEGEIIPGTRYRVLRFLGDGGMGAVYEAQHVDLERKVALKVLLPRLCRAPQALAMFRSEARTASKVGADQIVDLYDFAELEDGRLMFTMELLDGPTLSEVVRGDGPLTPARVIGVLRQLCKGLAAAHAVGIVHRDIKPDNIVLVRGRDNRADTVKILDFGIATILEDEEGPVPLSVGTPHYLAPELIAGTKFDQRSDVYSVGCTAYELLTGRPPFVPRDGRGLSDILDQHVNDTPRRPSKVRPEANIPEALEDCVMRCLAKVPSSRYRSMDQLEAALCEAQIEARFLTSWDDLPVPEKIDPALRDRLLRQMPDPSGHHAHPGRRWMWPVFTALVLLCGVGVTYSVVGQGGAALAEDEDSDAVELLVAEARTAASRNFFVYPPADTPDAPTAYRKVRELEKLEEPDAAMGRERARELRAEFAETLLRLGDEYWEREQGKPFAIDYYRQALVFHKGNVRAAERASLSDEDLETFERKAEEVDFTEEEIAAAEELVAMAPPDRERRGKGKKKREDGVRPPSVDNEATDALLGGKPASQAKGEEEEEDDEEPAAPKPPPVDAEAQTSASDLVASARKLARGGDRKQAELFYKRALTYDPRNAGALTGMYDLEFGRGKWKAAEGFAERLVAATPGTATAHLKLGDARFKLGTLASARDAYERAAELGSARAKHRVATVDAKLAPKEKPAAPEPEKAEDAEDTP
jgi:serine/threonine protein kinase/tetratricopeptide (TPR) repeat protein